jgi:hypothetical protein
MTGTLITVAEARVPLHTLLTCACWEFAIASSRVD